MVSVVGMKTVETKMVNGMTVYLNSDAELLDEVVVVAYDTVRKESLTGSASQIDNKTNEKRVAASTTAAIESAAPGIQVNDSYGEPDVGPSILLRGTIASSWLSTMQQQVTQVMAMNTLYQMQNKYVRILS